MKKKIRTRKNQQILLNQSFKIKKEFGGSLLRKSNAKTARPISTKEAMHIVLRSSLAKGQYSMLRKGTAQQIRHTVDKQAKQFGIRIYEYANVGNHIHILVHARHRVLFKSFLRSIAGLIARITLGAERGRAKLTNLKNTLKANSKLRSNSELQDNSILQKFWDQRPFTRIVTWKRDFMTVKKYVIQNFNEAMGFIAHQPRTWSKKSFSTS